MIRGGTIRQLPRWSRTVAGLVLGAAASCAQAGGPGEGAQPWIRPPAAEEPITLSTPTGRLHGTLLAPVVSSLRPVALIIAGSGPTDRDGNSAVIPGRNDSLRLLAEALAAKGVATLRYDKRGIGASAAAGPSEADLRFETYVDDAAAWIERLRAEPRFSSVTVIGHSEGSAIGILAAESAGADAFVSVAGIARRPPEILREQLRPQLPPELYAKSERILAALESGRPVAEVPPALLPLYRPSVQPYLISWFRADPLGALARADMRVMIAQGTTDIQVPVAEAHALHAARPGSRLVLVDGMNHVLKLVPADPTRQTASYSDPDLPVAPALVDSIAAFVQSLPRR